MLIKKTYSFNYLLKFILLIVILFLLQTKEIYAQVCDPFTGGRTGNAGQFAACNGSADCAAPYICVNSTGTSNINGACMTVQQCTQGSGLQQQAQTALGGFINGSGPQVSNNTLMGQTNLGLQKFVNGGPSSGIAQISTLSIALYKEPPASTQTYLAYISQKMHFPLPVKDAYAQSSGGIGFASLGSIIRLWAISRDLALIGFVVIFTVIGIMIMLRQQIDARTVVTIQQALPKIIIALVLVIFSYPLYGLLIDGVTLITRIGAWTLQSRGLIAVENSGSADANILLDNLLKAPIFGLWDQLYNTDKLFDNFSYIDSLANSFSLLAGVFGLGISGGGASLLRTVVFLAMFVALLRTFFLLLTSYLMVTLNVIFSPFRFLMMAIPGSGATIGSWLRSVLAHLLVFPTVFFMLALAAIFASQGPNDPVFGHLNETYQHPTDIPVIGEKENLWRTDAEFFPPGAPRWVAPALGDWNAATGGLLALGILLTVPRAGTIIREAVQYKGSQSEGEAAQSLQKAAGKVPIIGSLSRF